MLHIQLAIMIKEDYVGKNRKKVYSLYLDFSCLFSLISLQHEYRHMLQNAEE